MRNILYPARALLGCLLCSLPVLPASPASARQEERVRFEKEVIDSDLGGGHGITVTDIDGDGRMDVLALACCPSELSWYRNPDWQKTVIDTELGGLVDVAPHDIDGDGHVDLAVSGAFGPEDSGSGGQISWLRNPWGMDESDWSAFSVDRLPIPHRLDWADVSGTGTRALITLPVTRDDDSAAGSPGAGLTAYTVSGDPTGPWGRVVLDDALEMAQGLHVVDWDRDGRQEVLIGSHEGIDVVALANRGQFVTRDLLVPAQYPERTATGVSEVVAGRWDDEERFLATLEPYGNEVVVYRNDGPDGGWQRTVIDDSLSSGHALLAVDLDNDGRDEIVAGGRGEPYALHVYHFDESAVRWRRTVLDQAVAVSGLAAADLDGNGRTDIVAVGASTANLVIYHNMGR